MNQELYEKLREMRLPIMAEEYKDQSENEYIKLDRDKSTFKSHRDFSSEIEITFKHF